MDSGVSLNSESGEDPDKEKSLNYSWSIGGSNLKARTDRGGRMSVRGDDSLNIENMLAHMDLKLASDSNDLASSSDSRSQSFSVDSPQPHRVSLLTLQLQKSSKRSKEIMVNVGHDFSTSPKKVATPTSKKSRGQDSLKDSLASDSRVKSQALPTPRKTSDSSHSKVPYRSPLWKFNSPMSADVGSNQPQQLQELQGGGSEKFSPLNGTFDPLMPLSAGFWNKDQVSSGNPLLFSLEKGCRAEINEGHEKDPDQEQGKEEQRVEFGPYGKPLHSKESHSDSFCQFDVEL